MCISAMIALAGFVASPAAAQQEAADSESAVIQTIAQADSRISIPVKVNGSGPWPFVIDTGSERTVISRALASQLGLVAGGPVTILAMSGPAEVSTVAVPDMRFGATRMHDTQAPVLEAANLGAPGLLGLDGMRGKRLVMNFRTGKMTITSSLMRDYTPDIVSVDARRRDGQLILLDCTANGRKVHVILDTGSEYSIGNRALMEQLARTRPSAMLGSAQIISVTGEALDGQWGVLDRITMGKVALSSLPVMFTDGGPFAVLGLEDRPALLLGVKALRQFDRVAIDFGRRRVDFLLPDQSMLQRFRIASAGTIAAF
ncbi:aspartyl protease family protein [Sphingobium sp. H39-3-25]|uniref:aspartyl protease family protein n=1 Tax=Sphingobium arseniciresistens TaxID=3030834 RepID=UPI0023B9B1A6|nr:aspartyl protease family protein [Sphingobium arseniciresistens]